MDHDYVRYDPVTSITAPLGLLEGITGGHYLLGLSMTTSKYLSIHGCRGTALHGKLDG